MTAIPFGQKPQPALRPLVLPTEHGGWGFLFEPLLLAMVIAPSWGGLLLAIAAVLGFLTRQPLKLAMQDALRGKSYPRTAYCWLFAAIYSAAALVALLGAIRMAGFVILVPLGLVAPLAITTLLHDANNKSRALLAELSGAAAMSSTAAAIAIAGGSRIVPALVLSGIIIARTIPAIVYVRALIQRSHGRSQAIWPSVLLHALAVIAVAAFASPSAAAAMIVLFARAVWGLTHEPPRAKTLGWREIGYGVLTVAIVAVGY
jgi:hypothetical protein